MLITGLNDQGLRDILTLVIKVIDFMLKEMMLANIAKIELCLIYIYVSSLNMRQSLLIFKSVLKVVCKYIIGKILYKSYYLPSY